MSPIMYEYKFITTKDMTDLEYDQLILDSDLIHFKDIGVDLIGRSIEKNQFSNSNNISHNSSSTIDVGSEGLSTASHSNQNKYIPIAGGHPENSESMPKSHNNYQTNIDTGQDILISTPVAIFTTAYARLHMAELKYKYRDYLLYTDTDSLFLTKELPSEYVGKELGRFKLEYDIKEAVFIAPKTYGLIVNDTNSEPIVKVKGYKSKLPFEELKSLLNQDVKSIELHQVKFYKNLSDADIQVLNTLKITYLLKQA